MSRISFIVTLLGLLVAGTAVRADAPPDPTAQIRLRAESFVETLRSEQWTKAASFVIVSTGKKDAQTRRRMGIASDANPEAIAQSAGDWLKRLYGSVKPGRVISVRLHPQDPNLALVTYKHDDIDGFYLRQVDGEWYYTLDENPEPEAPGTGTSPRH
jgi:hypothetical protein